MKELISGLRKSWRWYWMPAAVFLFGMSSIILLLLVDGIGESLRHEAVIEDAIMDIQKHTVTYHLRLEEALTGNVPATVNEALAALDQAIRLVEVILRGGGSENKRVSKPLTDPELRARAEKIKSLLMQLRRLGLERQEKSDKSGSGSILEKEFHATFDESLGKLRALEDIIERGEAITYKKSRRLSHMIIVIWAFIVVAATAGLWSSERRRKGAEEEVLKANEQLLFRAEELTKHRKDLTRLVEVRTAELTDTIKLLNAEIDERRRAEESLKDTEKQIRHLSSRLINAQEIERRRISMELHDELGQALNGIKLHIRVIEKGLQEDQKEIKKDCEKLLEYMDHVIEDVRRLSLNLSPTVLEDLGLTAALRWLINGFDKGPAVNVTSHIAEIDHLFPENQWITIYRVIQEALTNIGKHAQAENVSIVIGRQDDKVSFLMEDDGKGFDLKQAAMEKAPEKGLGLTTMNERVRMMGGVFDLWSQEGKGTRITFSIPIEKGDA